MPLRSSEGIYFPTVRRNITKMEEKSDEFEASNLT